jgi:hypothetical protein
MFVLQVAGKEQFTNLAKAEIPLNLEHGSDHRPNANGINGTSIAT